MKGTRTSAGQRLLTHVILIVLAIPFLLPLLWMVSTSLKEDAQIFPREGDAASPFAVANLIPSPVAWHNYSDALVEVPFLTYLGNTVVLCVLNVVCAVLSSAVVAYGFARLRFRFREPLFVLLLMTMALPAQVTMIPQFVMFRELGWYGTFLPLIIPPCFGVPLFIFLMRQFFLTIPEEMIESARLEGASEWQIFRQLVLPLSIPVLATCALFQFLGTWNDFVGPLIYLNDPNRYTLAYGLQQFLSEYGGRWSHLMAASAMFIAPVLVLFFLTQRTFIQGIATTGSKGG